MESTIILALTEFASGVTDIFKGIQDRKVLREQGLLLSMPKYEDIFPSYLSSQSKNNLIIIGVMSFLVVVAVIASVISGKKTK